MLFFTQEFARLSYKSEPPPLIWGRLCLQRQPKAGDDPMLRKGTKMEPNDRLGHNTTTEELCPICKRPLSANSATIRKADNILSAKRTRTYEDLLAIMRAAVVREISGGIDYDQEWGNQREDD